jgi:UDP-glucose 4-epimerase
MKVAITGANGFFAGYLIRELEHIEAEPILLTRREGSRYSHPYVTTDYSLESLMEIFSEKSVDAIVHLAAPRKVAESLAFYSDFFEMTRNVYEAAYQNNVPNVIYASTISIYAGDALPYSETDVPAPRNVYGLSKLVGEHIGNIYNSTKGMKIKNLRFAHLYGANENNNYMINKFFRQAYHHEQMLVNCESVAKREMMYAKDAAFAILRAIEHSDVSGTFNAGSGDVLTNEEIARTICAAMSPELQIRVGDDKEHLESSYMDSGKINSELTFQAKYTLKTAMPEIYQDMQSVLES